VKKVVNRMGMRRQRMRSYTCEMM